MKKARNTRSAAMPAEYDFATMKGGVRGKYVRQLRSGSNLVLLEPDVAEAFPTATAVNQALRAALNMASVVFKLKPRRSHAAQRVRPRATPHAKRRPRRAAGR